MGVRELLSSYQFPGGDISIIKGSALAALEDGNPVSHSISFLHQYIIPFLWDRVWQALPEG
ncbi:hypothetical protein JGUZn3_17940 [Entomobacter blattae]|uniref:Uncharacterized protein n=1 Tax=Entomobacter blattae TaxID=2762277 RepID=A0A7H1NT99_9PROT|nr:hypothetical protein JGUZn3_17940 [Entomobacter blattae]